jgi:hypothetical protein
MIVYGNKDKERKQSDNHVSVTRDKRLSVGKNGEGTLEGRCYAGLPGWVSVVAKED